MQLRHEMGHPRGINNIRFSYDRGEFVPVTVVKKCMVIVHQGSGGRLMRSGRSTAAKQSDVRDNPEQIALAKMGKENKRVSQRTCEGAMI